MVTRDVEAVPDAASTWTVRTFPPDGRLLAPIGKPLPRARRRRPVPGSGDLLVTQVKSTAGCSYRQERILVSLGLYGIGQAKVRQGDQGSVLGQIRKVQHLVEVLPVVETSEPEGARWVEMTTNGYDIEGRPAERQSFETGEHAQVELFEGYYAMTWSSAQSAAAFVRALDAVVAGVDSTPGRGMLLREGDEDYTETTAAGAAKAARWDAAVEFARLDYDGIAIMWSAANDGVDFSEVGLISRRYDPDGLVRLLRATGSVNIRSNAKGLVRTNMAFVAKETPSGDLWPGRTV